MPVYKAVAVAEQGVTVSSQIRLIEAKTAASALAHAAKRHIDITRPTSAELASLGKDGVTIEQAE